MKTSTKTKEFFKPMTLEEVKAKVKTSKRGFHDVEFISGTPIIMEHGILYVTTRMSYRFSLNYGRNNVIRFEKAVYKTVTKEDAEACRKIYGLLSKEQQSCVSNRAMSTLADKEAKLAAGTPIVATERKTFGRKRDEEVPNIVYCSNGSTVLTCYKSFQYNVHKKEYRHPETHYYLVNDESVVELSESDPSVSKALATAKATSRALAGKKASKTSLVYTPSIGHILTIGGDK